MNTTKLIQIIDPQRQQIRETVLDFDAYADRVGERMVEGYSSLQEAAVGTSMFPQLMRQSLRTILFDEYGSFNPTWPRLASRMNSNNKSETWIEGNQLGTAPIVPEGVPYPRVEPQLDRSVQITNDKRGYILPITREMIDFDQTMLVRQWTQNIARSMALTKEQLFYTVVTTTGNYTRTVAGGDNDKGNNQADTTFDADGMRTALTTLRTMKDRRSGQYLQIGYGPLVLIVTPQLEFGAKQLLLSPTLERTHGAKTAETVGTGTTNPFRGQVNEIIVSPHMDSGSKAYAWALMEARRAIMYQEVWPLELTFGTDARHWSYFDRDALEYKASEFYGFGMLNDRFAFYSPSNTEPTVA